MFPVVDEDSVISFPPTSSIDWEETKLNLRELVKV